MNKLYPFLLFLILLFSCVEESFEPCKTITTWTLDEDVKQWKKYDKEETLMLSDSSSAITIRCTDKKYGIEDIQVGICPPDFNEYIRMDFDVLILSEPINLEISYSNRLTLLNGDLTLYASKETDYGLSDVGSGSFLDSMQINGNYYQDVFNFEYFVDSLQLNQLVYSTKRGIVLLEIDHRAYTIQ